MKKVGCLLIFFVSFLILPKKGEWSVFADASLLFVDEAQSELLEISQGGKENYFSELLVIDFVELNNIFSEKIPDFTVQSEKKQLKLKKAQAKSVEEIPLSSASLSKKQIRSTRNVAGGYGDIVILACQESPHEVDPLLVAAIIKVESGFDHQAVSEKGAKGLMQIMPVNYRNLNINPFDPAKNIEAGVLIIGENLTRYHGNVQLALAAYNAGPSAVKKYGGIPPFKETRKYVKAVVQTHQEFKKL